MKMEELRKDVESYRSPYPDYNGEEGYIDPDYTKE